MEGSNDIIFTLDDNLKFKTINNAIKKHLNFQPADIISKELIKIINDDESERGVTKKIIHEKLESFLNDKKTVNFKAELITAFPLEPKEMNVHLEHVAIEGKTEIIGKATIIEEDVLSKFVEYEKQIVNIGNNLFTAGEISRRITRNLVKYLDQKQAHALRLGVHEIIINAIEHGNLGISYKEKSTLLDEDRYFEFIMERQKDPEYTNKKVRIEYSIDGKKAVYKIFDEGQGFDYDFILTKGALEENEEVPLHGRGIQLAKSFFDEIIFNKKGSQVILRKNLDV